MMSRVFFGLGVIICAVSLATASSDSYDEPVIRLGQTSTSLPADFSARNYMMAYGDLQQAWSGLPLQEQIDRAREHYLARHAENPRIALSKKFNPFIYLVLNPDILQYVGRRNLSKDAIESTALQHYINSGLQRRRPYYVPDLHMDDLLPSGLPRYFSSDLYLQAYPDVANKFRHLSGDGLRQAAINHYLNSGRYAGRIPFTSLFNGALYVQSNPDLQRHVTQQGVRDVESWGLKHFRDGGIRKNRRCFPLDFHPDAYRCMYQDLVDASRSSYNKRIWAKIHYATAGFKANRAYISPQQNMLISFQFPHSKVMQALTDMANFNLPSHLSIRVWLVMEGFRNPAQFNQYPGNPCGIRQIISGEDASCYASNERRKAALRLVTYAHQSGISFEQAIFRASQLRVQMGLMDSATPLCGLHTAIDIHQAVRARQRFVEGGLAACNAKAAALYASLRQNPRYIENVNLSTDYVNCTREINRLAQEWSSKPIQLNVAQFLKNPVLYLFSDQALDALPEVSERDLGNKLKSLQARLDTNEVVGDSAFLNTWYDHDYGDLTVRLISRGDFRKRINRLYVQIPRILMQNGTAANHEEALKILATTLYNTFQGRCLTGIGDGLDHLERQFNIRQESVPNPQSKIFVTVGRILIDYIDAVIDKHADVDDSTEFKTTCAHILRQRLRAIIPRGQYETVQYANLGQPDQTQNYPQNVLRKLFKGGSIYSSWWLNMPSHTFQPLTIRRLVNMVYDALSLEELTDYCLLHPSLFKGQNEAAVMGVENTFCTPVAGKGFYKKTVALVLLQELGIIKFHPNVNMNQLYNGGHHWNRTLEQLIEQN